MYFTINRLRNDCIRLYVFRINSETDGRLVTQSEHLAEFAATLTGEMARSLVETYIILLGNPQLSQVDIVSHLKSIMEVKLAEPAHAPIDTVDH